MYSYPVLYSGTVFKYRVLQRNCTGLLCGARLVVHNPVLRYDCTRLLICCANTCCSYVQYCSLVQLYRTTVLTRLQLLSSILCCISVHCTVLHYWTHDVVEYNPVQWWTIHYSSPVLCSITTVQLNKCTAIAETLSWAWTSPLLSICRSIVQKLGLAVHLACT